MKNFIKKILCLSLPLLMISNAHAFSIVFQSAENNGKIEFFKGKQIVMPGKEIIGMYPDSDDKKNIGYSNNFSSSFIQKKYGAENVIFTVKRSNKIELSIMNNDEIIFSDAMTLENSNEENEKKFILSSYQKFRSQRQEQISNEQDEINNDNVDEWISQEEMKTSVDNNIEYNNITLTLSGYVLSYVEEVLKEIDGIQINSIQVSGEEIVLKITVFKNIDDFTKELNEKGIEL